MTYYVPKTQKAVFGNAVLWVLGIFVVTLVLVGVGWRVGWFFQGRAVNYQSHILRNSYSNQQTLRDQITQQIGNVFSISTQIAETSGAERTALAAQRLAVAGIVCQEASEVVGDPLPLDQQRFIQTNCDAGSVSPGSIYNH